MKYTHIDSRDCTLNLWLPEKKKVLWEQAIVAAGFWGISNFFYSMISNHDFSTICLSWTGFLFTSLVYRSYQLRYKSLKQLFEFLKTPLYQVHHILRSLNWLIFIWLTIVIGYYA